MKLTDKIVANTVSFDAFAKTVGETFQAGWQRQDFGFLINSVEASGGMFL